jgi:hypothetical protein
MQQTYETEKSAARQFWDEQMEKHPNIHGILSIIGSVLGFFLNGHAIVKTGHWVIVTSGRIAETVLLFATLWITAVNIAPAFITHIAGGASNVSTLNSLSLIAFSLLPEVIVFSAIIITYEHWQRFSRDRRGSNPAWLWGSLYTLPTGTFVIMTVFTLGSFVSNNGTTAQITGVAIVIRCLAGWFYALVELIYITIGKRTGHMTTSQQTQPSAPQVDVLQLIAELAARQEERLNQIADEQRQALFTIQQAHVNVVPAIDFDALTDAVTAKFETGLQTKIEAFLSQRVTVSPALETPKIAAPRNVSSTHKRDSKAGKTTLTGRVKTESDGDPETVVYRLLDEDRSRSHRAIAKMTGIPDTTVYRIRKRYLEEHGNAVSSEQEANEPAI